MLASRQPTTDITDELRHHLEHEVEHVSHVLPGQGPIDTFVHHNTLHGLQHLRFEDAIAEATALFGGRGYLPEEELRRHHASGRITEEDLDRALRERLAGGEAVLARVGAREITAREVWTIALTRGVEPIDPGRLDWLADEEGALRRFSSGVPERVRTGTIARALRELGADLDRIGVDWTLADWTRAALGVDLPAQIRAEVRAARQHAGAGEVTRWLVRLEIPVDRREGYLRCIDHQDVVHPHLHALWLQAEARYLERHLAPRFDAHGSLADLSVRLSEDVEPYLIQALWRASLDHFGLDDPRAPSGPERHAGPGSPGDRAEALLERLAEVEQRGGSPVARAEMLEHARARLEEHLGRLGSTRSHRDFLLAMTGEDVNRQVHPHLTRACAAFLDEGIAALPMPDRSAGFYAAWRALAAHAASVGIEDLPGTAEALRRLPPRAADAVILALRRLGVEEDRWGEYLRRLLVQLPGWSGMVRWREAHPSYPAQETRPIDLLQYLAVRLFYEGRLVRRLCRRTWGLDGSVEELGQHFRRHLPELFVRLELFEGDLPEHLATRARALVDRPLGEDAGEDDPWMTVAEMIWMHRAEAAPARGGGSDRGNATRLFQLSQHLGLTGKELRALPREEIARLIGALDALPPEARGPVWLDAYELHYRDEVLGALASKRRQDPEPPAGAHRARPRAQVVFCIDDREESLRRHIEELTPDVETESVAGFFGVAMAYRGLDDRAPTPLCPIVVTPAHEVAEVARPEAARALEAHARRARGLAAARGVAAEALRSVLSSYLLLDLIGHLAILPLVGKILTPRLFAAIARRAGGLLLPAVTTSVAIDAADPGDVAPSGRRLGFTVAEQADRIAGTLRAMGLVRGLAPLVVLLGHGSKSENNPHLSAYDCGACGGKHGGPNARAFAAMANRPAVRAALRERGVDIPDDTWFVGGEHNTADDSITYHDLADVPPSHGDALRRLAADLATATAWSAHERCRRFASAPRDPTPGRALRHVVGRTGDFSQARPELGHVTNACAIVGRRAATRGVFLDRRAFLVSYDPTTDPEGKVLEGILLAVGPVGAGINLEYYFSTVDNAVYGCGTKVPHNVCGLIGVLEGGQGDLRTGLPRQMIEIHEPVRLQLIVEAKPAVLAEIYGRQAPLRELIGNGWVHLISLDPDSGELAFFHPRGELIPWDRPPAELPVVPSSPAWYRGKTDFLAPALISRRREPEVARA